MASLRYLIFIIEVVVFLYFFYVVAYNLVLAIAGRFRVSIRKPVTVVYNKIAVLIPAYREDFVILDSVKDALRQDYPSDKFDVIPVADKLQPETLDALKKLNAKLVEVNPARSTKVNALNSAMEMIGNRYDIGIILDADNHMDVGFLQKMNDAFNAGYRSVQAQRRPKNSDTRMAVLDGLSEDINNHIVRKGTCVLGWSSAIVGSGFGVEFDLLKSTMAPMDSVGGFDKELEIKLLQQGIKTIYLEDACLFDEKVQKNEVFVKQRKRWISSQYFYLRKYFGTGMRALLKGNLALFNSTVLRYVQLPRLLNIGLLFCIACIFPFFAAQMLLPFWVWPVLFLLLMVSVFLSVPAKTFSKNTFIAIASLPKTFLLMFLLLFRLKGANKNFIHTPHGAEPKK